MPFPIRSLCCVIAALLMYDVTAPRADAAMPSAVSKPKAVLVARTNAEFEALLKAGPTPLDAFTAYGRREFISTLKWSSSGSGLGGLGTRSIMLELSAEQILALLIFLDDESIGASLVRGLPDAPPLRFPEPGPSVERDWKALQEFLADQSRHRAEPTATSSSVESSALLTRYRTLFAQRLNVKALESAPLGDLQVLFDATATVEGASAAPEVMRDMTAVFGELERRGIDTRRHYNSVMRGALESSRQFTAAREFLARHPDPKATPLPAIIDRLGDGFRGRSVLDLDPFTNTLTRGAIDAVSGDEVIMVVAGGCHFSRDAWRDILGSPALLAPPARGKFNRHHVAERCLAARLRPGLEPTTSRLAIAHSV